MKPWSLPALSLNPFRSAESAREGLTVLSERLVLAMVASDQSQMSREASPEALWALGVCVAGWWLRGGSPAVQAELRSYLALPMLFGLFDSVKALPSFAAKAKAATDSEELEAAGVNFSAVVTELGMAKLKSALGNPVFGRLQTQLLESYPLRTDLREVLRPVPARDAERLPDKPPVEGRAVRLAAAEGIPVRAQTGYPEKPNAKNPVVSEETRKFLSERYPPEHVARILKV